MAEKDDRSSFKRAPQQSRPPPNRLYNSLGVKDLREILDKKRSRNNSDECSLPPPDPSYNYLKDPLREEPKDNVPKSASKIPPNVEQVQRRGSNRRGRGRRGGGNPQDIERPVNIKVKFSTSTGEHFYSFDEKKTLPTIKHVPDRDERGRGGRGRGRGERGSRRYQTRTIRNQNNLGRNQEVLRQNPETLEGEHDEIEDREECYVQQNRNSLGKKTNDTLEELSGVLAGTKISDEIAEGGASPIPEAEKETKLN